MKPSNFGEKNLTRFLNDELLLVLKQPMRKLGFPIASREKSFQRIKFDLYFFNKKKQTIVVVESEIKGWHDSDNLRKLSKIRILEWHWKPKLIFFQIFSPYYSHGKPRKDEKEYCLRLAKRIKKKYSNFNYYPLDINIKHKKFDKILNYFQKHKHAAKQYYSGDLKKEIRRLARQISRTYANKKVKGSLTA